MYSQFSRTGRPMAGGRPERPLFFAALVLRCRLRASRRGPCQPERVSAKRNAACREHRHPHCNAQRFGWRRGHTQFVPVAERGRLRPEQRVPLL